MSASDDVTYLAQVCDVNPRKPNLTNVDDDTEVLFVPMAAVDEETGTVAGAERRKLGELRGKSYTAFAPGDVLFAKITPCMENGKAAIVPEVPSGLGFGSTEFHVLRPRPGTNARYIWHLVRQQNFRNEAEAQMTGSVGQARVPAAFLKDYELTLPNEATQVALVALLDETDARVQSVTTHLAATRRRLQRARVATLAAAYSGRLTADWREGRGDEASVEAYLERIQELRRDTWSARTSRRYSSPVEFEGDELPEIPSEWAWASADAVCSQITDGEHIQPPYVPEGFPMLTAKHVRAGFVDSTGAGLISEEDFRKARDRCAPARNDLLVVSVGATTGRAAIVEQDEPFAIVRSVLLLKPLLEPRFLLRWLQNRWAFEWMTQASGASAQPHLYIRDVKRLAVPVPPLAEQREIVRRVEHLLAAIGRIEDRTGAAERAATRTTGAVSRKAFCGELPTDSLSGAAESFDSDLARAATGRG